MTEIYSKTDIAGKQDLYRPSSGFTLIEMLFVVVLLSMVTFLSVFNMHKAYTIWRFKSTAKHLMSIMQYAQNRALLKNKIVRLRFDDYFSQYWLVEKNSSNDPNEETEVVRILSKEGRVIDIPGHVTVRSEKSSINFYPDGTIDKSLIYLSSGNQEITLSTKEQRGFISFYDQAREKQ